MSQVSRGGSKVLTVTFYEYVGGPLYDASGIELSIVDSNAEEVDNSPFIYPGDVTKLNTGLYSYTYSVPADAPTGEYIASWTGTIWGETSVGNETFEVIAGSIVNPVEDPQVTLGAQEIVSFGGVFNPLYIDPEELTVLFPDATYLEIAEQVHFASLEVQGILKVADGEAPSHWVALEYIKAAVACALSKVYGSSDLDPSSTADQIRLGDLSVTKNRMQSFGSQKVNRDNAKTWCELAGALRKEMLYKSTGIRTTVRGSRYENPIPPRKIKPLDNPILIVSSQGQLDGPA